MQRQPGITRFDALFAGCLFSPALNGRRCTIANRNTNTKRAAKRNTPTTLTTNANASAPEKAAPTVATIAPTPSVVEPTPTPVVEPAVKMASMAQLGYLIAELKRFGITVGLGEDEKGADDFTVADVVQADAEWRALKGWGHNMNDGAGPKAGGKTDTKLRRSLVNQHNASVLLAAMEVDGLPYAPTKETLDYVTRHNVTPNADTQAKVLARLEGMFEEVANVEPFDAPKKRERTAQSAPAKGTTRKTITRDVPATTTGAGLQGKIDALIAAKIADAIDAAIAKALS